VPDELDAIADEFEARKQPDELDAIADEFERAPAADIRPSARMRSTRRITHIPRRVPRMWSGQRPELPPRRPDTVRAAAARRVNF